MIKKRKHLKGFTLMELLMASAIFLVVMLSLAATFRTGVFGYHNIETGLQTQRLARLILERVQLDLRNSLAYSEEKSRFFGQKDSMSFLTLIDSYQDGAVTPQYVLIAYRWDGKRLTRACRQGAEAMREDSAVLPKEMTDRADGFSLQYGRYSLETGEIVFSESWNTGQGLPAAVKISLTLNRSPFERMVALPLAVIQ